MMLMMRLILEEKMADGEQGTNSYFVGHLLRSRHYAQCLPIISFILLNDP